MVICRLLNASLVRQCDVERFERHSSISCDTHPRLRRTGRSIRVEIRSYCADPLGPLEYSVSDTKARLHPTGQDQRDPVCQQGPVALSVAPHYRRRRYKGSTEDDARYSEAAALRLLHVISWLE